MASVFILTCFLITFLVGTVAYFLIYRHNYLFIENDLQVDPSIVSFLLQERTLFFNTLAAVFFIMFGLLFVLGIYLSHKIAGPIYAIQRDMKKIISGNYNVKLKLRTKDELRFIEEPFNRFAQGIQAFFETRRKPLKDINVKIKQALVNMPDSSDKEYLFSVSQRIEKEL